MLRCNHYDSIEQFVAHRFQSIRRFPEYSDSEPKLPGQRDDPQLGRGHRRRPAGPLVLDGDPGARGGGGEQARTMSPRAGLVSRPT